MNQLANFMRKEFLHIFRDVRTMMMLICMPIIQLIIFGYAINTEIKNTPISVLDDSKTADSRALIDRFMGNDYFSLKGYVSTDSQLETQFERGDIKLALIIPKDFESQMQRDGVAVLQLLLDASDPNEASTIGAYAQQVIAQHQQSLLKGASVPYVISTEVKMLYNPQLKSAYNFVPGIMGLVLMLICAMMTSLAIVKEKEQGTMEILLVSPIKPFTIVIAKAIPYFVIAFVDVALILLLSYFMMQVPIVGSLALVLLLCTLFTLAALSLGMLISSMVKTQQAAMMVSGVGLMLPTLLLSGLIFPIENMPLLLRAVSNVIPAKWFIIAIKDVMIKGLGFGAVYKECLILLGMTVLLLLGSIKRFRNRL